MRKYLAAILAAAEKCPNVRSRSARGIRLDTLLDAERRVYEGSIIMDNAEVADSLAETALRMVENDFVVGLGSGRTATAFVRALARRTAQGLRIHGVATSQATADLARELGILLKAPDEIEAIDITVDGADEVDPQLNLIKGLGGALVREKIVAAMSRRLVIIIDSSKIVSHLGEHGVLPVEVIPFALAFCRGRLAELGYPAIPRQVDRRLFVSDNGNFILDCRTSGIADPARLENSLRAIPGIVGTGLFIDMADTVLIQDGENIRVSRRNPSAAVSQNVVKIAK
jgi:ribose 5-phosphate isomerase A